MSRPRKTWPPALLDLLGKGIPSDEAVRIFKLGHPEYTGYVPDGSAIRRRKISARKVAGLAPPGPTTTTPGQTTNGAAPSLRELVEQKAKLATAYLEPGPATARALECLSAVAKRLGEMDREQPTPPAPSALPDAATDRLWLVNCGLLSPEQIQDLIALDTMRETGVLSKQFEVTYYRAMAAEFHREQMAHVGERLPQ